MLSSYSVNNLAHAAEFLLNLAKTLDHEQTTLQKLKDEVSEQQQEAHKEGQLVKKMTNYLSDELGRLELQPNSFVGANLSKLSETETKLRILRGRLSEFVDSDDAASLQNSDSTLVSDLKSYESFLQDLTIQLNEKIPQLEKIVSRLKGECREAQQQKLLLREMTELFSQELDELDSAFAELKGRQIVS
jgi:flagellar biosynthesis chaperone FliJ